MLLVCSAILTLIPWSGGKPNDLHYVSLCPFAPWSTLALLMAAGLVWAVRGYLNASSE